MNEKRDIATIARAICAALGATLKHDEGNDWYASAVLPDGVTIGLHLRYGNGGRLEASCNLPGQITTRDVIQYDEEKAGKFTTRISCDPERAPAAIAKDITRRLLPTATTLHARALETTRKRGEFEAGKQRTLVALAQRLGCDVRRESKLYPGDVSIEVTGPDSIRIERIYCNGETAAAIVELLRAEKADKEGGDDEHA
jgi:hypothetical protein